MREVAWQFDERGWPLAVLPLQSPSGNCRQLWLMLIGPDDPGLPSWQALASQDRGGCEFGWEGIGCATVSVTAGCWQSP